MRTSAATLAALAAVLIVVSLPVLGHQGEDHGGGEASGNFTEGTEDLDRPQRRGYDGYLGRGWWGVVHEVPHPDSLPEDPVISDGWVAWKAQDTPNSADIMAYNLTRGVRVQITDDEAVQRSPALDGSDLVWSERIDGTNRLMHYDLEAGTELTIFETDAGVQSPTISTPWIAWQTTGQRGGGSSFSTWDVYAYDLRDGRTFPVSSGNSTDVDPAIVGDHLAWREREYSQWDIRVEDLTTGRETRVTADINTEVSLRAGDDSFVFLQRHRDRPGLHAYRYLPEADRLVDLGFDAPVRDGVRPAGDALLLDQPYVQGSTIEVLPPQSRDPTPLVLPRAPIRSFSSPANGTLAAVVGNATDAQLITFTYSPLAVAPQPSVSITQPETGDVISNQTTIQGTVRAPGPWPEPTEIYLTFESVDSWVTTTGTTDWSVTLDLSQVPSGLNTIRVAAQFPDGPPPETRTPVVVGEPLDFTKDLGGRFDGESQGLVSAILQTFPLLVVLLLALVAVILLALRTYLRWLRERYPQARYVPPDEPPSPNENPAEAVGRSRDRDGG